MFSLARTQPLFPFFAVCAPVQRKKFFLLSSEARAVALLRESRCALYDAERLRPNRIPPIGLRNRLFCCAFAKKREKKREQTRRRPPGLEASNRKKPPAAAAGLGNLGKRMRPAESAGHFRRQGTAFPGLLFGLAFPRLSGQMLSRTGSGFGLLPFQAAAPAAAGSAAGGMGQFVTPGEPSGPSGSSPLMPYQAATS
ncbi:MAG: hypothetical protein ACFWTZ_04900 [Burkholderia sp.]